MSTLVLTPRFVPAALQVTLEAVTYNLVKPDFSLAFDVLLATAVLAHGAAHLLEPALGEAHKFAHGLGAHVREAVVANSTPHIVVFDLETANVAVAVHQPHVWRVYTRAAREKAWALANIGELCKKVTRT